MTHFFLDFFFKNNSSVNKSHLMKKLEERNVCISNAKQRWNFIKKSTLPSKDEEAAAAMTVTGASTKVIKKNNLV